MVAAAIAFGLFALLLGVKTEQSLNNEMVLLPRPGLLATVVGLVFLGRFLLTLHAAWRSEPDTTKKAQSPFMLKVEKYGLPLAIGFLVGKIRDSNSSIV